MTLPNATAGNGLKLFTIAFILVLVYIFFRYLQPENCANCVPTPSNYTKNGTPRILIGCVVGVPGAKTVRTKKQWCSRMPLSTSNCAIPCSACYADDTTQFAPSVSSTNLGNPIFPSPNAYQKKRRGAGVSCAFPVEYVCTLPCIDPIQGEFSCNPCIPANFPGTEVV